MRLVDLDPQWVWQNERRIGFVFRSPTKPSFWQSCFLVPPARREQWALIIAVIGEHNRSHFQACRQGAHWEIAGGIDSASFETMSVTPSLDGSAGGLWHGFITNGEIVGGI